MNPLRFPVALHALAAEPATTPRFSLLPMALCVLATLPAAVHAADGGDPPAPAANAAVKALDTVVVTAQKRSEDAKLVPMSVSAIGGEELANSQIANVNDLTRNLPNVSFSSQGGAGLSNIEIRGISSQAGSATVGIYLDDVSLTTRNLYSQGSAEPRFFDVERVEVLRGPQGTLYGASSMGGTIKFISNTPDTKKWSSDVHGEISNTDHGGTNTLLQAVLNAPIQEGVAALRLGVQTGHDSGYIDQVDPNTLRVVSKGINNTDFNVLKLSLKVQASEHWSITPAVFFQRTLTSDIDASYLSVGGYQGANAGTPLALFQTSKIVREPGRDTLTLPSVTANGDLGFADLTAVASDYKRAFSRTQDGTSVNSSYLGNTMPGSQLITNTALANVVAGLPSAVFLDNAINQQALELRLTSKAPEVSKVPYAWVAGLYSARTHTDVSDIEPVFGINAAFTAAGANINDPAQFAGSFPGAFAGDNSYYSARHYDDRQNAIFGELTWYPSERMRVIAGLRYIKGTEDFTREGAYYFNGGLPPTPNTTVSSSKATPRFAINYDVTPQTTAYATASEGVRLGGVNRPVPYALNASDLRGLGLTGAPQTFAQDSLWNYELGSKSRFFDNRVSLNVAAFYIDWKNIQQDVLLPTAGFDFETNVGNAKSTGFEFETKARVTDDLILSASGGLTRAVFTGDVPFLGVDQVTGQFNVRSGDKIQGVPDYNLRLGGEYNFRVVDRFDSVLRLNVQQTGASRGTLFLHAPGSTSLNPDYNRPSYTTVDASWGATLGVWDVAFTVKNLTNNHTVLQQPTVQFVTDAFYLRPRTIGLSASSSY